MLDLRGAPEKRPCRNFGNGKDPGKIETAPLPVINGGRDIEHVDPSHHFVNGPEAEAGHDLPGLLRHEAHEMHDMFGLAGEFLPQLRVLGRHADRAGIQMTFAHHDAAERHERYGAEAELLGAEQGSYDHVAAGAELAVDLHTDAVAQMVHD